MKQVTREQFFSTMEDSKGITITFNKNRLEYHSISNSKLLGWIESTDGKRRYYII